MALLHRLLPRIRQTSPSVIALSLSLVSLGANAHSVSDVSTDTHAGQSVQSVRPEMGLPLPESCCIQIAQATGQPPATTGNSTIKENRDSANALSDEAFEKMLSYSEIEMDRVIIFEEKQSKISGLLLDIQKGTNIILKKILEDAKIHNFDEIKNHTVSLERLYNKLLDIEVDMARPTLICEKELSVGMFQYGFASNPFFVDTIFVRDGKVNPDKNRIQKLMDDTARGLDPCNLKNNKK